jgi:DNA-binding MarR family transcriptional regulator
LDTNQPTPNELADLSGNIRQKQYLYLSSFADMLSRFEESVLKVPLRFSALSHLIRNGGCLTPTELARLMLRSKHSITIIVDNLEKEGYIIRSRDTQDRRSVHIRVTPEGLEHVRSRVNHENPIIIKLLSCLEEDERQQLVVYLKRLRKALITAIEENQGPGNQS